MFRWISLALVGLAFATATTADAADGSVLAIDIHGTIGPATARHVSRAVDEAATRQAACLIIRLDTPGGALDATQTIVQKFLGSPIPIVVYVSPPGAGATSAGCFITLAADIAAMAPTTNIGAAHPVAVGPSGEEKMSDTMKQKVENYSISLIETIASRRNRNVEWAKSAVKDSASITAEQALKTQVIDLIAADQTDLLRQLDGRSVRGQTLHTAGAQVVELPMTLGESFLAFISSPVVFYILLLVAIYGIIGEVSNPGAILPGTAGAIAVILMLYIQSVLPVNTAGIALIGLAVAMFAIDVFAPTHGVLTAGGIIAFFLGSLLLFDRSEPLYRLSLSTIIPATAVTALFFLFVVGKGLAAQRLPVKVGPQSMIGRTTAAISRIDHKGGKVFVEGEYWNATSDHVIEPGENVEIKAISGLTLIVKPPESKT